ncbi:hypothetical protein [Nitratiruptor tergarcus]|uniref:Uncharacterized protein n=1 Tax=Nitratiruptor tergarcus DSM 16512 TaxID=1069081 RepID=A0A1W1WV47_9BACT|nr:hypothetical protein [Nitratiruptor tergarcus]SMC10059.1 hypothetical protein SAMN05660197_1894 [Nitratiruptor tergarcus DSM 16512]
MNPFEFENRLTIKVTPNQIHKIMDRIKSSIKYMEYEDVVINGNSNDINLTHSLKKMDINVDTDTILEKFENQFIQRYKYRKISTELEEDLLSIKEALFRFNVNSGISQKLSQIEILKHRIQYYQQFRECLDCETDNKKVIERAKEFLKNSDNEIECIDIKILFYNHETAKNLSIEANRKILELEKEITMLNASNEIEIKIYKSTAELVGLG